MFTATSGTRVLLPYLPRPLQGPGCVQVCETAEEFIFVLLMIYTQMKAYTYILLIFGSFGLMSGELFGSSSLCCTSRQFPVESVPLTTMTALSWWPGVKGGRGGGGDFFDSLRCSRLPSVLAQCF